MDRFTRKKSVLRPVVRASLTLLVVGGAALALFIFRDLRGVSPAASSGGYQANLPNGSYLYNNPANFPNSNACLLCHGWSGTTRLSSTAAGYFAATLINPFTAGASWGGHPGSALVDTDGDGFTNGEELQDPPGLWAYNATTNYGDQAFVANPNWKQSYPRAPLIVAMVGITNSQTVAGALSLSPTLRYAGLSRVVYSFASPSLTKAFTVTSPSPTNYAAAFCLGAAVAAPGACTPWNTAALPDGTYTLTVTASDKLAASLGGPQTGTFQVTNLRVNNTVAASPAAGFTPASLDFGTQLANTVSPTHTVQVANIGGRPLAITSTAISAYFTLSNNSCNGAVLAVGQSCFVDLAFAPVISGPVTGALTVTSTSLSSPDKFMLSGTGRALFPPVVTYAPASLDFGQQWIGLAGLAHPMVITNTGDLTLTITSAAASGPFAVTLDNCSGAPVGPNQACTVYIGFTPRATNRAAGTLTITSNAPSSPNRITLTGTGVTPTPAAAQVSPLSLNFGPQLINTSSAAQSVWITNTGALTLTLTGVSLTGDFAILGGAACQGVSLPNQVGCQLHLYFFPSALGPLTGMLTLSSTAASSPDLIQLSGTGFPPQQVWLPMVAH